MDLYGEQLALSWNMSRLGTVREIFRKCVLTVPKMFPMYRSTYPSKYTYFPISLKKNHLQTSSVLPYSSIVSNSKAQASDSAVNILRAFLPAKVATLGPRVGYWLPGVPKTLNFTPGEEGLRWPGMETRGEGVPLPLPET